MAEGQSSEDKTEDATPRKREEAREEGQVASSKEIIAALMLAAGVASLFLSGGGLAGALGGLIKAYCSHLAAIQDVDFTPGGVSSMARASLAVLAIPLLAMVVPSVAMGLAASFLQVGFKLSPKALTPKLEKFDPIAGAKRMFGTEGIMRTVLAAAKIICIAGAMIGAAWYQLPKFFALSGSELGPWLEGAAGIALRCLGAALLAILVLALIDFFYQRWQFEKNLRMSKQEVKDEHKNIDGDPQVKARIRRVQREMAMSRMMDEVPKATVVVTNPTHYAVALRYERGPGAGSGLGKRAATSAPIVVAKGVDELAQRIKSVATDAGVLLYEDVPLARALHARVEVGELIPEELYEAVAAVLRYVYMVRGQVPGAVAEEALA